MAYTQQDLDAIYARTNGRCHICGMKLARKNYGNASTKAPWHVEHSIPRAVGGTDHRNNLFAACIDCNLEKSDGSTRSARRRNGRTRSPLSRKMKTTVRNRRGLTGAAVLGTAGWLIAPELMLVGAAAGALLGHFMDVD